MPCIIKNASRLKITLEVENDNLPRQLWGWNFLFKQLTLNAMISSSKILGIELSLISQIFFYHFLYLGDEMHVEGFFSC